MTYNIITITIITIITIVCTKWIIGSVPLQKHTQKRHTIIHNSLPDFIHVHIIFVSEDYMYNICYKVFSTLTSKLKD